MIAACFVLLAVAILGPNCTNGDHLCCLPDQFTAKDSSLMSSGLSTHGGLTGVIGVEMTDYTLQYDATNKQIVYDVQYTYTPDRFFTSKSETEKNNFRVIQDFNTNLQYAIDLVKGTCATDKLKQTLHPVCQDERVGYAEVTPLNAIQINATIHPNITTQFQLSLGPCDWISPTVDPRLVKSLEIFNKEFHSNSPVSKTKQPFASGSTTYHTPAFVKTTTGIADVTMKTTDKSMFEIPAICHK